MWWKDGKLAWADQHCGIGLWTAVCKKSPSKFSLFFFLLFTSEIMLKKYRLHLNSALGYLNFVDLSIFYSIPLT